MSLGERFESATAGVIDKFELYQKVNELATQAIKDFNSSLRNFDRMSKFWRFVNKNRKRK